MAAPTPLRETHARCGPNRKTRVLRRLLTFCHEKQLICPYRIEKKYVQFIVESKPHSFTTSEALSYLITLTEEAGLGDQFHHAISRDR